MSSALARAVLWDLDGTLADSADLHFRAWRAALAAHGCDLTYDQFRAAFGQRNASFLRAWLGGGLTDDEIQRVGDEKEAAYRAQIEAGGLEPLPGAAAWAARLRRAGWLQAVASSAPRANIETMLRVLGLAPLFDAFVGAEDVTEGKPSPQVFLAAAARLAVPPGRCVVVEDAAVGIEGARRAGMWSVGVNASERLPADVYVRSLEQLPEDAFERLVPAALPAGAAANRKDGTDV
jgi:beta-phosphoglucomutase